MSIVHAGARPTISCEADLVEVFGRHAHHLSTFQRETISKGVATFGAFPQNQVWVFCLHRQRLDPGVLVDLNPLFDRDAATLRAWLSRNIPDCLVMLVGEVGAHGMLHWNGVIHSKLPEQEIRAKLTRLAKGNRRNELWLERCGYSSTAEGVARWLGYGAKRAGEKIENEAAAEWVEELFSTVHDRKRVRVIGVRKARIKAKSAYAPVASVYPIVLTDEGFRTLTYLGPRRVLVQNHRPLFGEDPPPYELRLSRRRRRWQWDFPRDRPPIRYVNAMEFQHITGNAET